MSTLRNLSELIGRWFNFTLIPDWRLQRYPQTLYLRTLFESANVDCVFDVGANSGQFRDFLRAEVGFAGWIISYEPIPELADAMRQRALKDPKWRIFPFALGREQGSSVFNVMQGSQFSSFLAPRPDMPAMFARSNSVTRSIEVEVDTLDTQFTKIKDELNFNVPYLKMDTQGFDLEVVAGGKNSIGHFVALQTEVSVNAIYESMPNYLQATNAIGALGFTLSATFPNNPGHFPELIEFDCHFVATDHISEIRDRYLKNPVWD